MNNTSKTIRTDSSWGSSAFHGPTLSESLGRGILEMIRIRGLKRGDALPNAKVLAEHFEVATPTIREALRKLEATGAVELRHGSGTYVGANLSRIVLPNPIGIDVSRDVRLQMLDARLVIEPSLAEMAAQRELSTMELDHLHEALEKPSWEEGSGPEHQRNFHRELAAAAGNVVLYEVVDSLLSVRSREQKEIRKLYDRQRDYEQHRQILNAVANHNGDDARELVRIHLQDIRDVVFNEITTFPDDAELPDEAPGRSSDRRQVK